MTDRTARKHRYAVVAIMLAVVLGVGLTAGTAGATTGSFGSISYSKQLLADTNRTCDGAVLTPSTKTSGGALMVQVRSLLTAAVLVQGATPNATYDIRVIQEGASGLVGSCTAVIGHVSTDARGNGLMIVFAKVLPGATTWWLDLNNQQNFADFLDTDLAAIAS